MSSEQRVILSRRECQVLQHVAHGLTNKEIGSALVPPVSDKVVGKDLSRISSRLGTTSRMHALFVAEKEGIVTLPEVPLPHLYAVADLESLRHKDVLRAMRVDLGSRSSLIDVGEQLGIDQETVQGHRRKISNRTGLRIIPAVLAMRRLDKLTDEHPVECSKVTLASKKDKVITIFEIDRLLADEASLRPDENSLPHEDIDESQEVSHSQEEPPVVAQERSTTRYKGDLRLSARECEVLERVAHGLTNDEIGQTFIPPLSANTIKSHLQRINGALGTGSKMHALFVAVKAGHLTLPEVPIETIMKMYDLSVNERNILRAMTVDNGARSSNTLVAEQLRIGVSDVKNGLSRISRKIGLDRIPATIAMRSFDIFTHQV